MAQNAYRQRGEEDDVVDAEFELLRSRGRTVAEDRRSNDELGHIAPAHAALQTFSSDTTAREVAPSGAST